MTHSKKPLPICGIKLEMKRNYDSERHTVHS